MKKIIYITIPIVAVLLTGCGKSEDAVSPPKEQKIEDIISKEYKSVHLNDYSKADTKMIINGSGNMVSLRDELKDAINLDFKVPFTDIKITPSNENYFRIIGDSNLVNNVAYKNENKIIRFDFKGVVATQESHLKLEVFSNQIEYIDNNSVNVLNLSGNNKNINIQNKGFLTVNLLNANYQDFLINNLGKISIKGNGNVENIYITDFNMGEYGLKEFKSKNLSIKTRGPSKGYLNVSNLTMGEIGLLSNFTITGNPRIKRATTIMSGKLSYQ